MYLIPPRRRTPTCVIRKLLVFVIGLSTWFLLPDQLFNQLRPTARAAATFTVNSLGDTPDAQVGNGICADSVGGCTLRAAIQEANSLFGDDTIDFSVMGTINLTGALPDITSNMIINGPGSGLLTVRRNTGGDYRIFFTNNTNVTISGMTITNGKTADGTSGASGGSAPSGGGLLLVGGVVTLTDLFVIGNRTGNGGEATGGSNFFGGSGGGGGGISASGTLTITNCVVSNNTTGKGGTGGYSGGGGYGGGILLGPGSASLTNVTVTRNRTGDGGVGINSGLSSGNSGYGGGISSSTTVLNMTNVNISNNVIGDVVRGNAGSGGGMVIFSGTATLTSSTVSNNLTGSGSGFLAQGGHAGGIDNEGTLIVTGSTINGNATGNSDSFSGTVGGGIYSAFKLTMVNSTVSGNKTGSGSSASGSGAGIYSNSIVSLTNCTVTANFSFTDAGGLYGSDKTTLRNTIIAGNTGVPNPDVKGMLTSQGHNLIGRSDGSNGFTNGINGDQVSTSGSFLNPHLAALANNGGSTLTHALLSTSPALDAGDNCVTQLAHCGDSTISQLTTDQRGPGFNRIADGPDADNLTTVDIGAYETQVRLEDLAGITTNEDNSVLVPFDAGDTSVITSVTATSSNPTLVPNDNAHISVTAAGSTEIVTITPATNLFGTSDITVIVNRTTGSTSRTFTLTVNPVNDAPAFTKGADQTVNEDAGPQSINNWATGISPGPANESGQSVSFLVTGNTNPSLFSAGPSISPGGVLTYTSAPNANGSAVISVVLKDDGGTANGGQDTSTTQTFTINVNPVNDTPTFTKGPDQTVNEDSGFRFVSPWATGISAGPNESSQSLTFLVTENTNTALFSSGPTIDSFGNLTYATAINANGSAVITIVLKDSGGAANGGVDASTAQTFTINVTAINDPPVNLIPSLQTTNQNTPRVFSTTNSNAISIIDVDAGTDLLSIALSTPQGTLTLLGTTGLTFITGDGVDDPSMSFTGTLLNLNAALNGLTYKPNSGFSGGTTIQITTDDLGHNGSGGPKSDTDTIFINVRAGGVLQFSATTYGAFEDNGTATIIVTRTGGNGGSTSVSYTSSSGTATGGATCAAGVDYLNVSGTLSWADNETTSKTIVVPICADSSNEPDETVNLVLSVATGSASLGTRTAAILSIFNDDLPVLLTEENSDRAIALDSVTQTRDPFTLLYPFNLSTDHRRRLSLFVWRLGLFPTDTAANVSVLAEDSQGTPYPLTVEYVGTVASLNDVTQVVVRLPENVIGAPRDLWVKVTLRGPSTNRGIIKIAAP